MLKVFGEHLHTCSFLISSRCWYMKTSPGQGPVGFSSIPFYPLYALSKVNVFKGHLLWEIRSSLFTIIWGLKTCKDLKCFQITPCLHSCYLPLISTYQNLAYFSGPVQCCLPQGTFPHHPPKMISPFLGLFLTPLLFWSLSLCTLNEDQTHVWLPSVSFITVAAEEGVYWVGEDKTAILYLSPGYHSSSPPKFPTLCRCSRPSTRNTGNADGLLGIALHSRLPKAND